MSGVEKQTFKEVPDSIDDMTAYWCGEALKRGGIISTRTKISCVDINRLINEDTGALDGGGMTATKMVRIKLSYYNDD